MRALRRGLAGSAESFPQDVQELQYYFQPAQPGQPVRAVPGAGLDVPIWLLGSSLFSAQLAAQLGLPFAFASHYAPDDLQRALEIYRRTFKPSAALERPHAMAGIGVFAADSDAGARRLFTSAQLQFLNLMRGRPGPLNPPVDDIEALWTPLEKARIQHSLSCSVVGSPETVARGLREFVDDTGVDELIVTAQIYDHAARVRSFEIVAQAF
jgi:luciferase family oxidoreductase group 1